MNTNWTEGDILVGGKRIHYYRAGAGAGTRAGTTAGKPAMLLIHGLTDNGLTWEPIAEAFADEYDVVMPDARGHGKSERVAPGEKLDMIADLAGVITQLELDRPVVGGHSMGAGETALLCARFPELARAAFLEDPPWRYPQLPDPGVAANMPNNPFASFIASLRDKTLDQLIAEGRKDHPNWPDEVLQRWCEGKKQIDPNFITAEKDFIGDWQKVAAAIHCPTLLITADPEAGAIITPQVAQIAQEDNSNIQMAHIANAGHHIRFAQQEKYLEVLRDFLRCVWC